MRLELRRGASCVALAAFVTTFAVQGEASADGAAVCVVAHRESQQARAQHHLLDAKQKLLVCGQTSCPELIRGDCTQWLAELEPRIPTVVLGADLEPPAAVAAIRVAIDGGASRYPLDGNAIAVDPGEHVFRFEVPGHAPIEQRVVVLEGEQARRILAGSPARVAPRPFTVPSAAFVLGAVGAVSLGVFTGFGIAGVAKKNDLDDAACRPRCPSADVDVARRDFAVADVALGIGVAAVVATAIVVGVRASRSPARTQGSSLAFAF